MIQISSKFVPDGRIWQLVGTGAYYAWWPSGDNPLFESMMAFFYCTFTHWGRVTHICVSNLTIIVSDNGLSPGRRQAIIWTNVGILLIRTLGTYFSEIQGKIHSFSLKKMHLKMSSAKWRLLSLGLNELTYCGLNKKTPFCKRHLQLRFLERTCL